MRKWVALGALFLAGCGTVAQDEQGQTPAETEETQAELAAQQQPPLVEGEPDPANPGFLVGPSFVDSEGHTYRTLVMEESNSVLSIDASILAPELEKKYDSRSLHEAVSVTARFAAEELATSSLAFDYSTEGANDWWDENKQLFTPGAEDVVFPALRSTEGPETQNSRALLYSNNGWDRGTPLTETRVENLTVTLESITPVDHGLKLTYVVRFTAPVLDPDGTDGEFTERTTLWTEYTVVDSDGQWLIGSYNTQWQTSY